MGISRPGLKTGLFPGFLIHFQNLIFRKKGIFDLLVTPLQRNATPLSMVASDALYFVTLLLIVTSLDFVFRLPT